VFQRPGKYYCFPFLFNRVPTHPGKSWIFSWIFQALESPGNESSRSWKVLENEVLSQELELKNF